MFSAIFATGASNRPCWSRSRRRAANVGHPARIRSAHLPYEASLRNESTKPPSPCAEGSAVTSSSVVIHVYPDIWPRGASVGEFRVRHFGTTSPLSDASRVSKPDAEAEHFAGETNNTSGYPDILRPRSG